MNDLKKRLIAVGLSAVTAVSMVSPVFAYDGTYLNTEDPTQLQTASETTKKVTVHFVDADGKSVGDDAVVEISSSLEDYLVDSEVYNAAKSKVPSGYEINAGAVMSGPEMKKNEDGSYTATCVEIMEVTVTIKKSDDSSYQHDYTVSIPNYGYGGVTNNKVINAVSEYVPDGYQASLSNLGRTGEKTFTLTVTPTGTTDEKTEVKIVIQKNGQYMNTETTYVSSYILNDDKAMENMVYEGYYAYNASVYASGEDITYDIKKDTTAENQYILNLINNDGKERKVVAYSLYNDGTKYYVDYRFDVLSTLTEDEVEEAIYQNYVKRNGEYGVGKHTVEKDGDSYKLNIYSKKSQTYYLVVDKAGVKEDRVTINVADSVYLDSDAVKTYLQDNGYVPDGYEFGDLTSEKSESDSYLTWTLTLTKKAVETPTEPTIEETTTDSGVKLENATEALDTLKSSLSGDLKNTYDEAVKENKKVEFTASVTTDSLNEEEQKAVETKAKELGYTNSTAFDITLTMKVDGEEAGTITSTSSALKFKAPITDDLKKDGRTFYVLRYHDSNVTELTVDEDGYFTTDKFSVYMLVYKDAKEDTSDDKKDDKKDDTSDDKKDDKKDDTSDDKKDDKKDDTSDDKKDDKKDDTSDDKKDEVTEKTISVKFVNRSKNNASLGETSVKVNSKATDDEVYTAVSKVKLPDGFEISGGKGSSAPDITKNSDGSYTVGLVSTKDDSETTETIEMHRLYNPNSGEHFYTSSTSEKNHLVSLGWKYEGIGWNAPKKSNIPVYRLYNANGGEHHYTMSVAEKNMLIKAGWSDEGIGWYSADPNSSDSISVLREYNPNAFANNHNYTTSNAEHSWLISLGWKDEGKAWYAVKK